MGITLVSFSIAGQMLRSCSTHYFVAAKCVSLKNHSLSSTLKKSQRFMMSQSVQLEDRYDHNWSLVFVVRLTNCGRVISASPEHTYSVIFLIVFVHRRH